LIEKYASKTLTLLARFLCKPINSLWLLAPLPPELLGYDFGTLAVCALLGALLPDFDALESKIKHLEILGTNFKPFLLSDQVVHRTDQHRGLLHSFWGLGLVAFITEPQSVTTLTSRAHALPFLPQAQASAA